MKRKLSDYPGFWGGFFRGLGEEVATRRFSSQLVQYRLPLRRSAGQRLPSFDTTDAGLQSQ